MRQLSLAGLALVVAACLGGASCAQSGGDQSGGDHGHHGGRLRAACGADLQKFCADADSGGHHRGECLRQHHDELSDACKTVLDSFGADHHDQSQGGPSPTS